MTLLGVWELSCAEARPGVKVVRHVGGILSADGRHEHDTRYRVSRARRMVGVIARSWSRGQKDRRGRSSPLSLPLQLSFDEGPCLFFPLFADLGLGLRPNFVLLSGLRPMLYVGLWS